MNLLFSGGSGYEARELKGCGWDQHSFVISGTGPCAPVGHASTGQANVHPWDMQQWDGPMCISGTGPCASVGRRQWDRPMCLSGAGISGTCIRPMCSSGITALSLVGPTH